MLILNSVIVVYAMKKNHANSNNTPNIRHKRKIKKYEKYFQIQSQTSYAK